MKPAIGCLLLLAFLGCTQATYFPSLDAAVNGLPELSLLASQFDIAAPTLAAQLRAPTFVGTLFAPVNATLSTLQPYLKLPQFSSKTQDYFSMAVVPGPPIKLSDLVNGAVLTTFNNKTGFNTVTVKVTQAADGSGPIYYINGARISRGNVYAGNLIIHETSGLIVPTGDQALLNVVLKDVSNPPATVNLSPEGPPQPSPSPAAVPSPSPSPAASPAPATTAGTSPSPPAVALPSPSPAVARSPSPSPAVVASPSPSPAAASSPPAVVTSPSPSPAPARSPNPSPAASPGPIPASSSPAPSTSGGSDSGEVINIPQPLPSPSPTPATNTGGDGAIVTESGGKSNTSIITTTTNATMLHAGTAYSAASKTVVDAMVLTMPAVLGFLLLL